MMKWFEMGYDRANTADRLMSVMESKAKVEDVCPGYRRTSWLTGRSNTLCLLGRYEQRNIYNVDTGLWEPIDTPFYRAQLTYDTSNGKRAQAMVEFDHHAAMLKRSCQYEPQAGRNPVEVWDEAMAALDESIYTQARKVGIKSIGAMIERPLILHEPIAA